VRVSPPLANRNFAAVLLAGGRSTRMGRDKAALVVEGQPLWRRQLAILRALDPRELFISGPSDGPYAEAGVAIVEDTIPGLGPLGGIAAVLERIASPRVVVLAIDLPAMTPDYLAGLLREETPLVPERSGFFEPLAAAYPKTAQPVAAKFLGETDRSLQRFVRELIARGLVTTRLVTSAEDFLFRNINAPGDLA
jgi:molybdopterin-guanine dinucleotide biosynthesis protein A